MTDTRPRRLRTTPSMRDLVSEVTLDVRHLVMPIFVREGSNIKNPVSTMPGIHQYSLDRLEEEILEILSVGIKTVMLFGIPEHKDDRGSGALDKDSIIPKTVKWLKQKYPELIVITDVCLCDYTAHGHCGILNEKTNYLDNDKSLEIFAKQALNFAQAGADIVAPSSSMDNIVMAIRRTLDQHDFHNTAIMSYSTKYASSLYGPFREAANVKLAFGDRKTHMLDYRNSNEALKEAAIDIDQGTDFIMIKPAHTYLDLIYKTKQHFPEIPLGAYHVSGEYSMIKAASAQGWLNEDEVVLEVITAIKRAGANVIISYYAKHVAKLLRQL